MRKTARLAAAAVIAVLGAYAADAAWVRVRLAEHRDPTGSVEVDETLGVPLKNGRVGLVPGEIQAVSCVHALFPQIGLQPCWYLARHAHRQVEY